MEERLELSLLLRVEVAEIRDVSEDAPVTEALPAPSFAPAFEPGRVMMVGEGWPDVSLGGNDLDTTDADETAIGNEVVAVLFEIVESSVEPGVAVGLPMVEVVEGILMIARLPVGVAFED